ncbi:MAG: hypothetical protein IKE01_06545 [Clostridia bacterium]|nr:hypothetical protein [Clostridia bacterium]
MYGNLDITYCSNTKCKNKNCERNQANLPSVDIRGNHPISIADMYKNCKEREK